MKEESIVSSQLFGMKGEFQGLFDGWIKLKLFGLAVILGIIIIPPAVLTT